MNPTQKKTYDLSALGLLTRRRFPKRPKSLKAHTCVMSRLL